MRDTPELALGLSGYHYVSLGMAVLGLVMFVKRGGEQSKVPIM